MPGIIDGRTPWEMCDASPAPQHILSRIVGAIGEASSGKAEREIARFLAGRGRMMVGTGMLTVESRPDRKG